MGPMGCRGHRGIQNQGKQSDKMILQGILWRYGRENLAGHYVFENWEQRCVNTCKWIITDLHGRDWVRETGGAEKQGKNFPKCVHTTCFVMHVSGQKIQKVINDVNTPKQKKKNQQHHKPNVLDQNNTHGKPWS